MKHPYWWLRATLGYWLARRLLQWQWLVRQPRAWRWMEGQFARMAALGNPAAQDFYGHLLLFRGQGLGAREEGLRLLRLAADAGQAKAAFQLGVQALREDGLHPADPGEARRRWEQAAAAGHPLAAHRLAGLLASGAPGLPADPQAAEHYAALARRHGL